MKTNYALRSAVLALATCASILSIGSVPVFAKAKDYRFKAWLNPINPVVGENYAMYVEFRNTSNRTILVEVWIDSVPNGDRLLSPQRQERYLAPGEVFPFRFDIECGRPGGNVAWNHRTTFAK